MLLDTRTGIINFYSDPFKSCLEEHELRYCRAITDLDQEKVSVELSGQNTIKWSWGAKPFAVHSGGILFLFLAQDEETFTKWTTAFKSLEISKFNSLQLWVDRPRQRKNFLQLVEELSPWVPNEEYVDAPKPDDPKKKVKKTSIQQLNGFLCKTSQI